MSELKQRHAGNKLRAEGVTPVSYRNWLFHTTGIYNISYVAVPCPLNLDVGIPHKYARCILQHPAYFFSNNSNFALHSGLYIFFFRP
jgi:hypothetical protein